MGSGNDSDVGAGELGTKLVKAFCRNALLRAIDVEGGNRGVMGSLFGQI